MMPTLVVYAAKNRGGQSRLGLTAGKPVGNAVKRNRAKRLMRGAYRALQDRLTPGYDYVIVARTRMNGQKEQRVLSDMRRAMEKLKLFRE